MAQFSVTEAAFSGFRFVREHPRAAALWAVFQLVVSLVTTLLLIVMAGPALTELQAMSQTHTADPSRALGLLGRVAPAYLLILLISAGVYAVLYGAASRAVLRPADQQMGYLRFGADELRQFLLILLIIVVAIGADIAGAILVLIPTAAASAASKQTGLLVSILACIAVFCAFIFFWVRLSLASPLTFQERRVNLFGSWELTRGRFWALVGVYLLVLALAIVVGLLCFILAAVLTALVGGGFNGIGQLMRPDLSSVGAYLSPVRLVNLIVWAGASGLLWPLILLPAAEVYRQVRGPEAAV